MRLELTTPGAWDSFTVGDRRALRVPGAADIIIVTGPLITLPRDVAGWIERALRTDCGPGTTLERDGDRSLATEVGWAVRLVSARVLAGAAVREHRVGAFYTFGHSAAVALVRATDGEHLAAAREAIDAILLTGRPNWEADEGAICLADLYEPLGAPAAEGRARC